MPNTQRSTLLTVRTHNTDYFREMRWSEGKKSCVRCSDKKIYELRTGRLRCKTCGLTFGDFTGTYLGQLNIPIHEITHLLYLFSLGLPVYRCRHYISVSMKTAHRAYTLFRQAIYDESVASFRTILSNDDSLKELFGTGDSLGFDGVWRKEGGKIVFGIIQSEDTVMTFPLPPEEREKLIGSKTKGRFRDGIRTLGKGVFVASLPVRGRHLTIQRRGGKRKEKVTQTKIDAFWTYMHEFLYSYHGISMTYFHLYLKEVEFRYNNRTCDLFTPLAAILVKNLPNDTYTDEL
jgi:transposase